MRTFKKHIISGKTFKQATQKSVISGSKSYKSSLNIYIKSLNTNTRESFSSPRMGCRFAKMCGFL